MIAIASDHVSASILLEGGILWEPRFRLAGERWATPLAKAPWADDAEPEGSNYPAYIRRLGGAFLGLPFGGRAIVAPVGGWATASGQAPLHGLCATDTWRTIAVRPGCATIALDFPADSEIAYVEQSFVCASNAARIDVSVTIHARRAEAVAVGYHPILRLPEEAGALELRIDFGRGYTAPLPNGSARTLHDVVVDRLAEVPAKAGGTIDLAHVPTGGCSEEMLLLARVAGSVVARYHDAGYDLALDWDRATLPNCLIWYHDRATDTQPWDGRFRGIGIEPCASAFDFSMATSLGPNPLTEAGERTSITLSPDTPVTISCSLSVEAFG